MNEYETQRQQQRRRKDGSEKGSGIGKILLILFSILFFLALTGAAGIYMAGIHHFKDRFLPNTTINGFDASEMTVEEVEEKIGAVINAYKLDITERGGLTETITAEEIGYHYVSHGEVQTFFDSQKKYEWPLYLSSGISYTFKSSSTYDPDLLAKTMDHLDCFNEDVYVSPKDSCISYADGSYYVTAEVEGNELDQNASRALIQTTVETTGTALDFEEHNLYLKPQIRQDDEILNSTCQTLNTYINTNLTYLFGDNSESLTGDMVREWISYDNEGNVYLDENAVYNFVSSMADKYDTLGRDRQFYTHSGTIVSVDCGDYGWLMDVDATFDYLMDAIKAGNQGETYAEYIQTAVSWYNSDLGDSFVEVDLGSQHLWLYLNGYVVLESDFVSGTASDSSRITPSGTYTLYYKESPSVLKGENAEYESKVEYWMPFNGGIGFHDASWRSAFGGSIYLTNGSHGCINMPLAAARTLYENIYDGIPIICYY